MASNDSIQRLLPILPEAIDQHSKPGVSARALYAFLELTPTQYARWTKKNIVKNPYAAEHADWEAIPNDNTRHDGENRINTGRSGNASQDYVLSIDLAKRLAMMARSAKGEEARTYFLDCERRAQQAPLPVLHDPVYEMMIKVLIDQDEQRHQIREHDRQLIAQQAQIIEALMIAREAIAATGRMTIEEFVFGNGLLRQFPGKLDAAGRRTWPEEVERLKQYCQALGIEISKVPVSGKPWPMENGYPVQALIWLSRNPTVKEQLPLRVVPPTES